MFKTKLKFTHLITAVILTLGLSVSFQSLLAGWTAPTANPPDGNVGEPLNSGPDVQEKTGCLGIVGDFVAGGSLVVDSDNTPPNVGINCVPDPLYALDVDGSINFSDKIYQNGVEFNSSYWTQTASNQIYYNDGQVGINVSNPISQLAIKQTGDDPNIPAVGSGVGISITNSGNARTN